MELTDEALELVIEIAAYDEERIYLTKILKELDEELIKRQDKDKDDLLYMQECIERYKTIIKKLKILLECYFAEEKKNNFPIDLNYRKYYKLILTAI